MSKNWLIEHHFARGDFAFCLKIIHENLQEDEKNEYSSFVQGRICLSEGRVDEALKWFQSSYAINPNNANYLQHIAKCLMNQGRHKKAAEALMSSLSLTKNPDFSVFYDLACCYSHMKDYAQTEMYCKEAGKMGKTKEVYQLLAECLVRQGKIGEAIETFRVALRNFPKSSELYASFGLLCSKMNFDEEALKSLQTAIKLDGSNSMALFELGVIHQKRCEYDEAITNYRNALHIDCESAAAFNNLGLCYFHKNKFVAALTCLQQARYLNAKSGDVLFNLGLVYATLHQYCSALVYWRSAVAVGNMKLDHFISACTAKIREIPQ